MQRRILTEVKKIIPPLSGTLHKGQAGRIGVVGGSKYYTGAPFFAAMSAMRLGCDLAYVICEPEAALVIKTYSPDLIVHPILEKNGDPQEIKWDLESLIDRLHTIVIGPGLGREEHMQEFARVAISVARERKKYIVVDADGLWLIQKHPEYVKGYRKAVLTPNVVEFERLRESLGIAKDAPANSLAHRMSQELGDVVILQKGAQDIISNGRRTEISNVPGGLKRCGGQGDILSGTVATFLAWGKVYEDTHVDSESAQDDEVDMGDIPFLAACGGSAITRITSRTAFSRLGRGVVTGDMLGDIGGAYIEAFGEVGDEKAWKGIGNVEGGKL